LALKATAEKLFAEDFSLAGDLYIFCAVLARPSNVSRTKSLQISQNALRGKES